MSRKEWAAVLAYFVVVGAPWSSLFKGPHPPKSEVFFDVLVAVMALLSVVLLAILLIPSKRGAKLTAGKAFTSFVLTFAALVGAYASLDLQASAHFTSCFVESTGKHVKLGQLDSIYFALTTLSTTGFGDITAHSHACRRLLVGEMSLAFPILGLAIAGVAARIFEEFRDPAGDAAAAARSREAAEQAEIAAKRAAAAVEQAAVVAETAAAAAVAVAPGADARSQAHAAAKPPSKGGRG